MHPADHQMLAEFWRRRPNKIREQRRFELAKAALTGYCASGRTLSWDAATTAVECVRNADAVLAAMESDEKDRSAAA